MSFGICNYDVIYDVISSMQTLKGGTLKAPCHDVYIDTFSDHCVKLYGWILYWWKDYYIAFIPGKKLLWENYYITTDITLEIARKNKLDLGKISPFHYRDTPYETLLNFTTENFTTWKVFFLPELNQLKFLLVYENGQSCFYFDVNWCARVCIKQKRNMFKWLHEE